MPSTISIVNQLKTDFPQFNFATSDCFYWSPTQNTVFFDAKSPDGDIYLLHELSHAVLGHLDYDQDIQLISMERAAWDHSKTLADRYNVAISDDFIQSTLDSYRDWLHSRSSCPKCSAVGVQSDTKAYKCPACSHIWTVNEARKCALRRRSAK